MIEVLLYYRFTPIADPQGFRDAHEALCRELGLKGRIYIAAEGLNGTCAGAPDATAAYRAAVEALPGFASIHWKRDTCERVPFTKLHVRVRSTIVNLGLSDDVVPDEEGGVHLSPAEWREALESDEPYLLLDVRNGYEWDVGHFDGALRAPFDRFHEFDGWIKELGEVPRDTRVLMYCTGGIRCEKFSGLMKRRGFERVEQLSGGILGYAAEQGGAHYEGECFVFDDRMRVDIGGRPNETTHCERCGTLTTRIQNCANMDCHRLFVCCEACAIEHVGTCCDDCKSAPRLRPFDVENLSRPFRKKGVELAGESTG